MIGALIGIAALTVGILVLVQGGFGGGQPQAGRFGALSNLIGGRLGGLLLAALGIFLLAQTSYVFIDADRVGHLKRVYAFQELPEGRIIALPGQKGPQARILGPGFHFIPLVRVLYQFEERPVIEIPQGYYGEVTTLDGAPMPDGMFIAPKIPDDRVQAMIDAATFMTNGGIRGPQETVLKPGNYRINQYLFKVTVNEGTSATVIPAGHVGVVKSNVREQGATCVEEKVSAADQGREVEEALTVPLVPKGCFGIWREPLFPGAYYLNRAAYEVTLVDTRVKSWEYKGGYIKRTIDLTVDQEGSIKQTERSVEERIPEGAADRAVLTKIEGWDIPLELRAQVQIQPENAPIVVGSVGGIDDIENRILTPVIRSIVRNVTGGQIRVPVKAADGTVRFELRATRALDLLDNRDALEKTIEELVKIEGRKAGVEIKEIRLGEPAIPPELLTARRRIQLANEFSSTYERETAAQMKRIEREQARATADEQPRLVESQISVQVATQREAERAALGRAERQFLEELARGQRAQADVLGQDRVALLQALEKLLASLERKPELVALVGKLVPNVMVNGNGDGGGLAGAAAILGTTFGSVQKQAAPAAPAP